MSRTNGENKIRVDINLTAETKRHLDDIVDHELQQDRRNDRPERSKSEILEMVLRKGCRVWEHERRPGRLQSYDSLEPET